MWAGRTTVASYVLSGDHYEFVGVEDFLPYCKRRLSRILREMVGWYSSLYPRRYEPQIRALGSFPKYAGGKWTYRPRKIRIPCESSTNGKGERMAIPNDRSTGGASDGFADGGFVGQPQETADGFVSRIDYGISDAATAFAYALGTLRGTPASAPDTFPDSVRTRESLKSAPVKDTPAPTAESAPPEVEKRVRVRFSRIPPPPAPAPKPTPAPAVERVREPTALGRGTFTMDDLSNELIRSMAAGMDAQITRAMISEGTVTGRSSSRSMPEVQQLPRTASQVARDTSRVGGDRRIPIYMENDIRNYRMVFHITLFYRTAFEYRCEVRIDSGEFRSRNPNDLGWLVERLWTEVAASIDILSSIMRDEGRRVVIEAVEEISRNNATR